MQNKTPARSERLISSIIIGISTLVFVFLLVFWFLAPTPFALTENLPGEDNRPAGALRARGEVKIGEYFQKYSGRPGSAKDSWPRFRGPDFTNTSRATLAVTAEALALDARVLWKISLGEGHAAPAVAGGRVYVLDYDETRRSDALRCFSLDTGEEIWRRWYSVALKRNHGLSRSIPAVSGDYVVTMGPRGHVMCVEATSGAFVWGIDVEKEYESVIPQWYTAQCPLIDGQEAIIAPAGTSLFIGIDLESGKVKWKTPNTAGLAISHSSIIPATIAGKRLWLYAAIGGLAGVSAEAADRGKLLFVHAEWDNSVIAPSPVPLPDGRVFLTAGYGGGSMLVQIIASGAGWQTRTLYRYRPKEGLACEQQTPILYNGFLYGVMPKDGGDFKNQFVCFNPDTGKIVWTTGKNLTFGLGPFILADNKFFILSDTGVLTALAAGPAGFDLIGRSEIMEKARDAWGPIAIAGRRMLMRDSTHLVCVELK